MSPAADYSEVEAGVRQHGGRPVEWFLPRRQHIVCQGNYGEGWLRGTLPVGGNITSVFSPACSSTSCAKLQPLRPHQGEPRSSRWEGEGELI